MSDTKEKRSHQGLALIIGLILVPFEWWVWATVIVTLYAWFVLALFPTLPRIGVAHVVGLALLLSVLRRHSPPNRDEDNWKILTRSLFVHVTWPLSALLVAWLFKTWLAV